VEWLFCGASRAMVDIYLFLGWDRVEMLYDTYLTTLNRDIISRIRNAWRRCQFVKWASSTGIRGLICRRVLIHSLYGACPRRPS
jgi:hypothetical protein